MRKLCHDAQYDYYVCDLRCADVRFAYIFLLTLQNDEEYYFSEEGVTEEYDFKHGYYTFFQFPFINEADVIGANGWAKEAIVYQIFIDRFRRGDGEKDDTYITQEWREIPKAKDFAGGDLRGIAEKLDYIREMGFNALYLTPVFKSPSNHKYNITDYRAVDPMFGGDCAMDELIAAAHGKGMHIILDAVFNHCDESEAHFADVKEKGRASEFYDWFIVHGDFPEKYSPRHSERSEESPQTKLCNYEIFADCPYMPKWNTSDAGARAHLLDIALGYLSRGVDGLRLDVADEVSHTFWRELKKAVSGKYADALLIGEVWHENGMYLGGDQFDGVMNYKLQKIFMDHFACGKYTAEETAEKIARTVMRHRRQTNEMMLNFLDNHDTPRFLRLCGEDEEKLRTALVALYFSVGIPCVFYGTELPLTGDGDPDCRRTYDWDREARLAPFLRELARVRKLLPKGEFYATAEQGVLVLVRENGRERVKAYFGKVKTDGEVLFEFENGKLVKESVWIGTDY